MKPPPRCIDVHSIGDSYAPVSRASSRRLRGSVQSGSFSGTCPASDDFHNRSRLTCNREGTNSNYGAESCAPFRNMFQNAGKEELMVMGALAGSIMKNETPEVIKETLARRRWVLLCWLLTWWIPSPSSSERASGVERETHLEHYHLVYLHLCGLCYHDFSAHLPIERGTSPVHRSLHHIHTPAILTK